MSFSNLWLHNIKNQKNDTPKSCEDSIRKIDDIDKEPFMDGVSNYTNRQEDKEKERSHDNMASELKLQSPWITYMGELKQLFGRDPEIKIEWDDDTVTVKLYVENPMKAAALMQLLPAEKEFGSIIMHTEVIPANTDSDKKVTDINIINMAFKGNPVFEKVVNVDEPGQLQAKYCIFRKEVLQFFNDDLTDINGNKSTLAQDIAKEMFKDTTSGICFCTSGK